MVRTRESMKALILTLTVAAGGLVGCESMSGNPGGAVVPIDSNTAGGQRIANQTGASIQHGGMNNSGTTTAAPARVEAARPAPAPAPAPAAAPAARPAPAPAVAPAVASGSNVAYYPSCNPSNAVLRVEKIAPSEATAGAPVEYQIKVTNLAGCTVENVMINEQIPGGFTAEPAGNGGNFNLGQIASGQSKTITVRGTASSTTAITSCATASYTLPVCMTIPVVSPALQLVKSAPAEGTPCDTWPVKLVVTNSGSGTARDVVVRDELPAGLKTSDGKSVVEYTIGNLAAGQSREMTFNVKADNIGSFNNTATASSNALKVNSNATTTVIKAPKLTIDKICPQGTLRLGRPATFDIVVTNTGNFPSNNTIVRDQIPSGAQFVSATDGGAVSGGAVVWNLGTLAPGASRTVKVTMSAPAGTVNNQATVQGDCAPAVSDACSISLQGVPDIGIGLDDVDGVRTVGEAHEFTYVVRNQGQVDLTNVTIVADFETGLEYRSTTWAGGATAAGQRVTWKLGTLPVGQERVFKFVAVGRSAKELIVQTVTTSDQTRGVRADEHVYYID